MKNTAKNLKSFNTKYLIPIKVLHSGNYTRPTSYEELHICYDDESSHMYILTLTNIMRATLTDGCKNHYGGYDWHGPGSVALLTRPETIVRVLLGGI